MIRASTLIWAGLVVLAGLFLYQVKHDVQTLEDELAGVNRRILATQDRIHVLRAEWSLLNEPERLGDLAQRHLALAPMRPDQFARPADVAERVALSRPGPAEPPATEPRAPAAVAVATAETPALPLPPPFPPKPPQREIARPAPPDPPAASRDTQPEGPQRREIAVRAPERPAPARETSSPTPRPDATDAPPPVQTAALPSRPEAPARPAAVSALGAPAAALPPPVPRPAGGPR
ncbi:cell division protein FtsL [Elioraea sp.]|uniref:cell division protein FtsL n=1 Tax=Elioraea sp. TaxID=2185103 RepID=UPI003F6F2D88